MAPPPRIGTRIRRAMERKRMNQTELAAALGVSRSAVNAWINGRAYPQASIGALEEVLGVSLDDEESPQPYISADLRKRIDNLTPEEQEWVREQLAAGRRLREGREDPGQDAPRQAG